MTNKENANTQVLMNSDFSFLFGKIRLAPNITHETDKHITKFEGTKLSIKSPEDIIAQAKVNTKSTEWL